MNDYFLPSEKTVERIDELCVRLFELWCEERKLVPLAYLLHCWPLTGHDTVVVKRLADAMSDLCQFQAAKLSARESTLVREIIGNAREIIGEPLPRGAGVEMARREHKQPQTIVAIGKAGGFDLLE